MLNPLQAPALELAALYPARREIEGLSDELKTHPRANSTVLRSNPPDLDLQDLWGLQRAHFAARQLMTQAGGPLGLDQDRRRFTYAARVITRNRPQSAAVPPERLPQWRAAPLAEIAGGRCLSRRGHFSPRGVKRKVSDSSTPAAWRSTEPPAPTPSGASYLNGLDSRDGVPMATPLSRRQLICPNKGVWRHPTQTEAAHWPCCVLASTTSPA
jgi:hypothetical protein